MLRQRGDRELIGAAQGARKALVSEQTEMKSKIGAIIFVVILLIVAFGIISFAAEFFLGKPLDELVEDLLFMIYRK